MTPPSVPAATRGRPQKLSRAAAPFKRTATLSHYTRTAGSRLAPADRDVAALANLARLEMNVSDRTDSLPGFKTVCTVVGVLYAAMGASMVVRGVGVLRDFAVPESDIASPVLQDFFFFFYELMIFIGALMVLFGHVTVGRRRQTIVASVFVAANLLFALRDLSTSDTAFGNRLYRGEATMVFVAINLAIAAAFASPVLRGWRR
jgi:hypothetical protein